MMTIFEKLDLVKKTYRYSLHELANLCEVGVSTISRIISKKYMPSYSTIQQISKGTNIPVEYLINDHYILDEAYILSRMKSGRDTESNLLFISPDSPADPIDEEITHMLAGLNNEQKQCVLMMISIFLKDNKMLKEAEKE